MGKEDMEHIYSGILLKHKKEQNWVIYRDADGRRDYHTVWVVLSHYNWWALLPQKLEHTYHLTWLAYNPLK